MPSALVPSPWGRHLAFGPHKGRSSSQDRVSQPLSLEVPRIFLAISSLPFTHIWASFPMNQGLLWCAGGVGGQGWLKAQESQIVPFGLL